MESTLLIKGLVIGFLVAAPVGPIGVLCIRRTLVGGPRAGIVSGLGAATADAIYGCIAGFGLVFVSGIMIRQQVWLRLIGGVYICYLGIRAFVKRSSKEVSSIRTHDLVRAYASTLFLTLSNPMTILSFGAVFAGLGLAASSENFASAAVLISGVFAGSASWWLILSAVVGAFRERIYPDAWQWVNMVSGALLASFGVLAILSAM